MSHKEFVSKMEVEKWYMCDGQGKPKAIQFTNANQSREEEKIPQMEPEWKQEEPKNQFTPF